MRVSNNPPRKLVFPEYIEDINESLFLYLASIDVLCGLGKGKCNALLSSRAYEEARSYLVVYPSYRLFKIPSKVEKYNHPRLREDFIDLSNLPDAVLSKK